jgi:hypothetical protein
MSVMMDTMADSSYYSELLDALEVKESGIHRAMLNGEDPRKIEQARLDVLDLKDEIRELEAQGHSTSWW